MQNDTRPSISGYQCFCAWEVTERLYDVTIRIKRSDQSEDLDGPRIVVPHCGGALRIKFADTSWFESENRFSLLVELSGKPATYEEARLAVVRPHEDKERQSMDMCNWSSIRDWLRQLFKILMSRKISFLFTELCGSNLDEAELNLQVIQVCPTCRTRHLTTEFQWELTDDPPAFPSDILLKMADNMTRPFDYNIEFQAKTSSKEKRSLYVHRAVLSGRSQYYETSIFPLQRILIVVFNSHFLEWGINTPGGGQAMTVRTLPAHDEFEVLHPHLYYIYTDRVYFTNGPIETVSPRHNVPMCNAENAYRLADLYSLEQLKEKVLAFLMETIERTNIIPQIFGEFALTYDAVGKGYEKIFYQHWNDIRRTNEMTELFQELLEGDDKDKKQMVTKRYVALMGGIEMKLT
jgi:BTB/POZ domain